jgi:outer membrane protein OmpA-like peptidoglycan-associated protein/Tol biopolymer transport system component
MNCLITKLATLLSLILLISVSLFAEEIIQNTESSTNDLLITQVNQKHLYGTVFENQSGSQTPKTTLKGIGAAGNPRLKIINLGASINSSALDYAPSVTADGKRFIFVSNRPGSKELPNGKLSTDFWAFTKKNAADTIYDGIVPYNIDLSPDTDQQGINTILNEGVACISAGGNMLLFTGCNRPDGLGDCDIYAAKVDESVADVIKFTKPQPFRTVNSEHFDSQPTLTPNGKRMYFTSTRPGPNSAGKNVHEEMDIWYSDWDDFEGEWKVAKNLTEINSPYRDCSPYICADGKSLIFSSDRSGGFGGLDFYVTYLDEATNTWSAPQNLGRPLNTSGDDQFITISADGKQIYFSSSRTDIQGNQGGLDLYMGWVPVYPRTIIITGTVVDECAGDPINANVSMTNKYTGKVVDNTYIERTKSFQHILTWEDFIKGSDTAKEITIDITSSHPRYGSKTVSQKVSYHEFTEFTDSAAMHADSFNLKIPMGERPKLSSVIAEADYIQKSKGRRPELASFRGLVMAEQLTFDLYPLLTYVFFDEGEAKFPDRYHVFKSKADTKNFTDTTIIGGTLEKYYHILNIFGFRLNKYPNEKIILMGNNDDETAGEKKQGLSEARANLVFNYLKDIWGISADRIEVKHRNIPEAPSNRKDSLGMRENRRVEIRSTEWEVYKPIFDKDVSKVPQPDDMKFVFSNGVGDDLVASRKIVIKQGGKDWITLSDLGKVDKTEFTWDWTNEDGEYPVDNKPYTAQLFITTTSGAVCTSDPIEIPVMQVSTSERLIATGEGKTKEDYSLILFPFGSDQGGPINERVMNDYVYGRIVPTSDIVITGHTDIIGLFASNVNLSQRRATSVKNGIQKSSGGKFKSMNVTGVGPENPIYPNDFPEGRFYNRTVRVQIESTIYSSD